MADLDRSRKIAACEFTFTELSLLLTDRQSQEASQETKCLLACFWQNQSCTDGLLRGQQHDTCQEQNDEHIFTSRKPGRARFHI